LTNLPVYKSVEEVLDIAKKASGHRILDFNINNRSLLKNKGAIGQIIEEGIFHYPPNSNPKADFEELGLELKVTGIKKLKSGKYVAKERLVLNMINYMKEYEKDFETSSFWIKNAKLLLMFYLYENEREDYNFMIIDSIVHEFSKEDLQIIKNDWKIITNKIKNGIAEEISEADTMYLGATTKGSTSEKSYRQQPASSIRAKQRAFCLKNSYVNTIVNRNFLGESCKSIMSTEEISNNTFEIAMNSRLKIYFGKSESELFSTFKISTNAKNKFNILMSAMLGIAVDINNTDEFQKAGIQLKTIRIEENNTIEQNMSFPYFEYEKIVQEDWKNAEINSFFSSTKFMFIIFKKRNNEYIFQNIKFWNMPKNDIEKYVKPVWKSTIDCIISGNIIKNMHAKKTFTNFPGTNFNKVCHVRPHDTKSIRKSNKGLPLPVKDKFSGLTHYTRYSFWLDRRYIINIINN